MEFSNRPTGEGRILATCIDVGGSRSAAAESTTAATEAAPAVNASPKATARTPDLKRTYLQHISAHYKLILDIVNNLETSARTQFVDSNWDTEIDVLLATALSLQEKAEGVRGSLDLQSQDTRDIDAGLLVKMASQMAEIKRECVLLAAQISWRQEILRISNLKPREKVKEKPADLPVYTTHLVPDINSLPDIDLGPSDTDGFAPYEDSDFDSDGGVVVRPPARLQTFEPRARSAVGADSTEAGAVVSDVLSNLSFDLQSAAAGITSPSPEVAEGVNDAVWHLTEKASSPIPLINREKPSFPDFGLDIPVPAGLDGTADWDQPIAYVSRPPSGPMPIVPAEFPTDSWLPAALVEQLYLPRIAAEIMADNTAVYDSPFTPSATVVWGVNEPTILRIFDRDMKTLHGDDSRGDVMLTESDINPPSLPGVSSTVIVQQQVEQPRFEHMSSGLSDGDAEARARGFALGKNETDPAVLLGEADNVMVSALHGLVLLLDVSRRFQR